MSDERLLTGRGRAALMNPIDPAHIDRTIWRIGDREYDLIDRPLLIGIINVTPDSFFDGGRYDSPQHAVDRVRALIADGADIIDIGAESTRPGAQDVSPQSQLDRLLPVLDALHCDPLAGVGIPLSVDTRSSMVADRVLDFASVNIINDISGLSDPDMPAVVAAHHASLVLMHSKGTPRTMQNDPRYADVIHEVRTALSAALEVAVAAGVDKARIALDPGIGFGKRLKDNIDLITGLDSFFVLERPLMVGVSRKSFLAKLDAGDGPEDRLSGSIAASVIAYLHGARIFRTHDVAETRKALMVARKMNLSR